MSYTLDPRLTVVKMPHPRLWSADQGKINAGSYHLDHSALKSLTDVFSGIHIDIKTRRTFEGLNWFKRCGKRIPALPWKKCRDDWSLGRLTPLYLTQDVWVGFGFSKHFKMKICLKISRTKRPVPQLVLKRLPKFCSVPLARRNYKSWSTEVSPYQNGVRLDVWRKNQKYLSEKNFVALALKLIEALEQLHKRGLVHGDFHPGNLLLVRGKIVVLDFEFTRLQKQRGLKPNLKNPSPDFLAPELRKQAPTFASDVYVLAKTLLFLRLGQVSGINRKSFKKNQRTWVKTLAPYLAKNPHARPKIKSLRQDVVGFGM